MILIIILMSIKKKISQNKINTTALTIYLILGLLNVSYKIQNNPDKKKKDRNKINIFP